jgi:uncharacterized membrane protein
MAPPWESPLQRWVEAGLLDGDAAARIRAWEGGQLGRPSLRWPAWLALGLGGLLLAAGILLFVAAHWDGLGPGQRFLLLLTAVGGLHLAGAFTADRSPGLSAALHTCGTVSLGGGIFLSGQIFHLQEHWPGGFLLWAIGAWVGWWLLRQWPQAASGALLAPAWLAGEWIVATEDMRGGAVLGTFVALLALAYLGAEPVSGRYPALRRALVWIGALGFIPASLTMVVLANTASRADDPLPAGLAVLGWIGAIGLPVGVGVALRRSNFVPLTAAAVWMVAGTYLASYRGAAPYLWCAVLAVGVIAWGVLDRRAERINLGIAGFALTVLVFYFSDVMDKLGRSASLIVLGLLFLGGGYLLEQARRRLVATVREPGR